MFHHHSRSGWAQNGSVMGAKAALCEVTGVCLDPETGHGSRSGAHAGMKGVQQARVGRRSHGEAWRSPGQNSRP